MIVEQCRQRRQQLEVREAGGRSIKGVMRGGARVITNARWVANAFPA